MFLNGPYQIQDFQASQLLALENIAEARTSQYDLRALLELGGARPRASRHDCPRCGGRRTLTHTDEVFYCHRCQWKGNTATLACELGLARRLSLAEARELRHKHEQADTAARALYERVKARRFRLLDELRLNLLLRSAPSLSCPFRNLQTDTYSLPDVLTAHAGGG